MDMDSALRALKPMMNQMRALQKLQEVLEQAVLAEHLKSETERRNQKLQGEKEALEATIGGLEARTEELKRTQQDHLAAADKEAQEKRATELSAHQTALAELQSGIAKAKRDYQATVQAHRQRLSQLTGEIQEAEEKLTQAKSDYEKIAARFK